MKFPLMILTFLISLVSCVADDKKEMSIAANSMFQEYTESHKIDASKMKGPIIWKDSKGTTVFEWHYIDSTSSDTAKVLVYVYMGAFKEPGVEAFGDEKT